MTLTEMFVKNVKLQKEWASDKNTRSPDDLTTHSRVKVWWRCEKGHEWEASLDSRTNLGRNCPYCANQAVSPGDNDLATMAPDLLALWNPEKNGDLKPTDITSGSSKKVWWRCEKGHEWKAAAYSLKAGAACPYCSGRNAIPGETDLATTHPQVLPMWSERNTISPTEVSAGSHKKVWWRCDKGHEWEALVSSVALEGCGCPYCSGKLAIPGETDLMTLRPDLMEQWDFEKNTLDPRTVTVSSHEKVWWKDSLGHSWKAMVFSRTKEKASGCPYCTGRLVLPGFNDLETLRPKLAEQWYQPLNGDLKPSDVTLGSNKKVWWECADGHVWEAFIYARTKANGTGCPVCAGMVKQRKDNVVEFRQYKKRTIPHKRAEAAPVGING